MLLARASMNATYFRRADCMRGHGATYPAVRVRNPDILSVRFTQFDARQVSVRAKSLILHTRENWHGSCMVNKDG